MGGRGFRIYGIGLDVGFGFWARRLSTSCVGFWGYYVGFWGYSGDILWIFCGYSGDIMWDSGDIMWIFWGYYVGFWGYYVVDYLRYEVADYLRYVLRDKIVMKNKDYKIIE